MLALCFLIGCNFFGAGVNPLFLIPGLLGPLLVLSTTPAGHFRARFIQVPWFFYACLGAMLLVLVHHNWFSYSADTSYIPSLVLLCMPLWGLTVMLVAAPRNLWVWLSITVAIFAFVSAVEFIFEQQRAHAPLSDPGNYVTLLGLVWIPWVFQLVASTRRSQRIWLLVLSFVFALAMLATHSRFALLIFAGLAALVVFAAFRFKLTWHGPVYVGCAIAAALLAYVGLDQTGMASAFSESSASGGDNSVRMLLWQSTWQAITQFGGIHGTGLYTFSFLYPLVRSPLEFGTVGILAHNDFLQLLLEGGLWLFLPMMILVVSVLWRLAKSLFFERTMQVGVGFLAALAMALAHATVNFVFYILPLVLLCGVLLARAFSARAEEQPEVSGPLGGAEALKYLITKWMVCGLLFVNVVYLSFDVMNFGVFSAQRHVPGSGYLAANLERMLDYSRLAQNVNGDRSLPIFAEAKILEAKLSQQPSPSLKSQTDLAYQRALETDPWNPLVYTSYATYLRGLPEFEGSLQRQEQLLDQALSLNRYDITTNKLMLEWSIARTNVPKILSSVVNVATWCKTMGSSEAAKELFIRATQMARHFEDDELIHKLDACFSFADRAKQEGRKKTLVMRWLESH